MWTKSIVRMPGLLVHAVTGVQKTNLRFNTDTDAVPFVLSPDTKHVDLNWDVPQVVLFFRLSTLWRVVEHSKRCLSLAPHHWPGQLHPGILTLSVLWVARLVRRCGQVLATQRFHSLVGRLRIVFPTSTGLLEINFSKMFPQ